MITIFISWSRSWPWAWFGTLSWSRLWNGSRFWFASWFRSRSWSTFGCWTSFWCRSRGCGGTLVSQFSLGSEPETSSWPVLLLISRNYCFSVWHLQRWPWSCHYLWFYFCKLMFSLFLVSFFKLFFARFRIIFNCFCTILQFFFTVFRIIFDRTISNMLFLQQLQTNWILKHDMNCTCKNSVHI